MYRCEREHQYTITDFDQPMGFKLNPENRWVIKAATIPWNEIEDQYAKLFPSKTGMPAKPLRTALGSLLLQKHLKCSDEELVQEITENPYFQYFIGCPGFEEKRPFVPSLMVEFRKRLNEEVIAEINEMIIAYNRPEEAPQQDDKQDGQDNGDDKGNHGTMILDATCAPQNISYPQDVKLLNEARKNLEKIIDNMCVRHGVKKPRMYRKNAKRDYLRFAKNRKHTKKKTRKAIKAQLQYVKRDLRYVGEFIEQGIMPDHKQMERVSTIQKVYEQQQYMYENKTHSVPDRIVSINQPYIRPIVRGKASAPVEFGAKLDLSIDDNGMARIEKISFDAYNESEVLIPALERYKERTGHYPKRVLADKIYRTRANLDYCKRCGCRLMGPPLGRPKKDAKHDKKTEYVDNADRVEVERAFSLAKRCYGLGRMVTKLENTTKSSIALSILAMNIEQIASVLLRKIQILVFSMINVIYSRSVCFFIA